MGASPLRLGALVTFATLAFACVVGLIAVFAAGSDSGGVGRGVGAALAIFAAGGTIAVALGCLRRKRLEWISLGSILAAGAAMDLIVLALWREIQDETYGKVAGIAFVWTFFALVALALVLAVGRPAGSAALLELGAIAAAGVAGLVSTWLVATAGNVFEGPAQILGNGNLLRILGAALVVLATLWFAALAASRLEPET